MNNYKLKNTTKMKVETQQSLKKVTKVIQKVKSPFQKKGIQKIKEK